VSGKPEDTKRSRSASTRSTPKHPEGTIQKPRTCPSCRSAAKTLCLSRPSSTEAPTTSTPARARQWSRFRLDTVHEGSEVEHGETSASGQGTGVTRFGGRKIATVDELAAKRSVAWQVTGQEGR
jgi:hypothetical protein